MFLGVMGCLGGLGIWGFTLPVINMETQKGADKTTVLLKGGYMVFSC